MNLPINSPPNSSNGFILKAQQSQNTVQEKVRKKTNMLAPKKEKALDEQQKNPLTPRQQRFVDEYLVDSNATQAALRAGYSRKTARDHSYLMLRRPLVLAGIQAGYDVIRKRNAATVGSLMQELEEARVQAMQENQTSVAVSAIMAKAKLCGLDIQRHQVEANMKVTRVERIIADPEDIHC